MQTTNWLILTLSPASTKVPYTNSLNWDETNALIIANNQWNVEIETTYAHNWQRNNCMRAASIRNSILDSSFIVLICMSRAVWSGHFHFLAKEMTGVIDWFSIFCFTAYGTGIQFARKARVTCKWPKWRSKFTKLIEHLISNSVGSHEVYFLMLLSNIKYQNTCILNKTSKPA